MAISPVSSVNNSVTNLSFGDNQENKTSGSNIKKYLTVPNVILGSLATIGVLGMADILICKGKHINKLTGKGKELEEALARATEAKSRATNAQTEIQRLQSIINNFNESSKGLRLHETGQGINTLEWMQRVYADNPENQEIIKEINKLMKLNGYEFADYMEQLAEHFELSAANIKHAVTTKPAVIDAITGEVKIPGVHCIPMSH